MEQGHVITTQSAISYGDGWAISEADAETLETKEGGEYVHIKNRRRSREKNIVLHKDSNIANNAYNYILVSPHMNV